MIRPLLLLGLLTVIAASQARIHSDAAAIAAFASTTAPATAPIAIPAGEPVRAKPAASIPDPTGPKPRPSPAAKQPQGGAASRPQTNRPQACTGPNCRQPRMRWRFR